jgi:hypothetical protein
MFSVLQMYLCSEIILDAPNGNHITVCANIPYAHKPFWTLLMVLLDDEAQVEARFCPSGDSAKLDAR